MVNLVGIKPSLASSIIKEYDCDIVERFSRLNHFAELKLTGIELSIILTKSSNSTTEIH